MASVKCVFVGDLAFGDHPKSVGFGFYSRYKRGIPATMIDRLLPKDWEFDVLFGNLEFSIGKDSLRGVPAKLRACRGISDYSEFLQSAGFNVLNLANNHIFQYGQEEFDRTIQRLVDKDISVIGVKDKQGKYNLPDSSSKQKVCILGWCERPRQGFSADPPYYEFDQAQCLKQISDVANQGIPIVASIHWGDEFIEVPSPRERKIARSMIEAGATVVVGHHPHAIREVEEYQGGLIAYSLGNFVCDMTWNEITRKTAALYVELDGSNLLRWKMEYGRIADDYFPQFKSTVSGDSVPDSRSESLSEAIYGDMAREAHKQHQNLTLKHMLKNCWRYPPAIWWHIFSVAIAARLPHRG